MSQIAEGHLTRYNEQIIKSRNLPRHYVISLYNILTRTTVQKCLIVYLCLTATRTYKNVYIKWHVGNFVDWTNSHEIPYTLSYPILQF